MLPVTQSVPSPVTGHRWRTVLIAAAVILLVASVLLVWHSHENSVNAAPEKSIAVLPFENLSDDRQNAYFAAAVQDEILSNLAKIADLKVISRASSNLYQTGHPRNSREIGQQLGVAYLLEGNVQRARNRVRVNAQLVDARTDTHLWAQTYDRDVADVFAIQTEIARAIAGQLQAKISLSEKAAIAQAPTSDLVANALYQQALAIEAKEFPNSQDLMEAVRLLDQAIARDPQFVLAYCLLGRVHTHVFYEDFDHTPARRELAKVALQNALRLQPESGEVHLALAYYAYHSFFDYDRARAELELARRALPNAVEVYYLAALLDRRQGRWNEAIRNAERAVELDPRNVEHVMVAGSIYEAQRRYSDCRRLFERALTIQPSNLGARILRAYMPFEERADIDPLRKELSAIVAEDPGTSGKIDDLVRCALAERDPAAAAHAVAAIPAEGMEVRSVIYPREWFAGLVARTFNNPDAAHASFTLARAPVAKLVLARPDQAEAWSLLGRIDAALGRKERRCARPGAPAR